MKVEVREVFKGPVAVGEKFTVPMSGGGDCLVRFQSDTEYLMYAEPEKPRFVWGCSRTRPLSSRDDAEVAWLRTGTLPPIPAALQRETVSCEPCDAERIGGKLVARPGKAPLPPQDERKALAALKARRPFLTDSSAASTPKSRVIVGRSWDGKPFELIQTPVYSVDERCKQQVQVRWCKRLDVSRPYPDSSPHFTCVEPERTEVACDENKSRTAKWELPEPLAMDQCRWRTPSTARCTLSSPPAPLAEDVPSSPLLVCRPRAGHQPLYTCSVESAPMPLQPE
ncbi:hypothetical protein ACLEPN_17940 [Myxococcus sp. 1LA]